MKDLYTVGYSRVDIVELFRFIDWLMALPEVHERLFWKELSEYEEEKEMPYVTSVEKIGIEKGMQQGSMSLLCLLIAERFQVGADMVRPMFEGWMPMPSRIWRNAFLMRRAWTKCADGRKKNGWLERNKGNGRYGLNPACSAKKERWQVIIHRLPRIIRMSL